VRLPGAAEHPAPPGGLALAAADVLPVSWVTLKDELNQIALADLRRLSLWVLAAIFVLCAIAQRSLRMVLLNFAALGLSFLLFGALLAVTGVALSPLSLLCVPLLIGLCIDYSLHVLMVLEHERDYGHLYAHIGVPILLTGSRRASVSACPCSPASLLYRTSAWSWISASSPPSARACFYSPCSRGSLRKPALLSGFFSQEIRRRGARPSPYAIVRNCHF
jgi:hypothetical protein